MSASLFENLDDVRFYLIFRSQNSRDDADIEQASHSKQGHVMRAPPIASRSMNAMRELLLNRKMVPVWLAALAQTLGTIL